MKKLSNYLLAGVVLVSMVFTSCSDDETPAPSINFTNNVTEATASSGSYTITGSITSEAGLKQVKFYAVTDAGKDQLELVDDFADKNLWAFQFTVTNIQADVTIEVEATDKENQTTSKNFFITVETTAAAIETYSITLGSYSSSTGSSFASIDGSVLLKADAIANSNKVDFMYFHGATNKATIAAPSDSDAQSVFSWINSDFDTKNATKFITSSYTAAEFDAVDDATDITFAGTAKSKETNLAVDDVFVFKTASTSSNPDKKGLAKVVSITGTGGNSTIGLVVKVEE